MKTLSIFLGGSSSDDTRAGGWACVLLDGDETREFSGYAQDQNRHRLLLRALVRSLEVIGHVRPSTFLDFHTDDPLIADALAGKIDQWKARNWKARRGRLIPNHVWWKKIWVMLSRYNGSVTFNGERDVHTLLARAQHLSKVGLAQEKSVSVYVDGSFLPQARVGGWGAVILKQGEESRVSGGMKVIPDNNAAEMVAVIEVLEGLAPGQGVVVHTDSQYVCNGYQQIEPLALNDWVYPNGRPISNKNLWQRLHKLTCERHVRIEWVKGHNGIIHNVVADRLAGEEARALASRPR